MRTMYSNVACGGMDVHYKFSNVTFRDQSGRVSLPQRTTAGVAELGVGGVFFAASRTAYLFSLVFHSCSPRFGCLLKSLAGLRPLILTSTLSCGRSIDFVTSTSIIHITPKIRDSKRVSQVTPARHSGRRTSISHGSRQAHRDSTKQGRKTRIGLEQVGRGFLCHPCSVCRSCHTRNSCSDRSH
jgi:hypothetical protein